MRFLALGDSYTIGEGVAPAERWPDQLVQRLRERGVDLADPEIVARTAWTTDELMDALDAARLAGPYDLVSLMAGVNDQYRSRPLPQFEADFAPLIARAVKLAGGRAQRVVVLSIPDWGATPFAEGRDRGLIAREIELYNGRARSMALNAGAQWHDVTAMSRAMLREAGLVAPDGLHPTGAMYRQWAESLLPLAVSLLAPATTPATPATPATLRSGPGVSASA